MEDDPRFGTNPPLTNPPSTAEAASFDSACIEKSSDLIRRLRVVRGVIPGQLPLLGALDSVCLHPPTSTTAISQVASSSFELGGGYEAPLLPRSGREDPHRRQSVAGAPSRWPVAVSVELTTAENLIVHPAALRAARREVLHEWKPVQRSEAGRVTYFFGVQALTAFEASITAWTLGRQLAARLCGLSCQADVEPLPTTVHNAVDASTRLAALRIVESPAQGGRRDATAAGETPSY
jgi:hypothetical protein